MYVQIYILIIPLLMLLLLNKIYYSNNVIKNVYNVYEISRNFCEHSSKIKLKLNIFLKILFNNDT